MTGTATRTEEIEIRLTLDVETARHRDEEIRSLVNGYSNSMKDGDTLTVRYAFVASYFGRVEKNLRAIDRILDDPGVIHVASVQELEHGKSLILSVANRLEAIINKLEDKRQNKEWDKVQERLMTEKQNAKSRRHWWAIWR